MPATLFTLRIIAGAAAGGVDAALARADRRPGRDGRAAGGDQPLSRGGHHRPDGRIVALPACWRSLIGWRGVFAVSAAHGRPGARRDARRLPRERCPAAGSISRAPSPVIARSSPIRRAGPCSAWCSSRRIAIFGIFPYSRRCSRRAGRAGRPRPGLALGGFAIGGLIYSALVTWMLRRLGMRHMLLAAGCFAGAAARSPWASPAAGSSMPPPCSLMGLGFYMLHNSFQTQVTEVAPRARASAVALHAFSFFSGQALGRRAWHGLRAWTIPHGLTATTAVVSRLADRHGRRALIDDGHPMSLEPAGALSRGRGRARRPGRAATGSSVARRSARTRRSGCRRADTNSRRCADSAAPAASASRLPIADRAILMERAMVAEAVQVELQRLRFDEPGTRHVVDHQDREIRLAGDRAERGEFRRGEAREVIRVRMRVRHAVELRLLGRAREGAGWPSWRVGFRHRV